MNVRKFLKKYPNAAALLCVQWESKKNSFIYDREAHHEQCASLLVLFE
jgi:hypothetical protein